MPELTEEEQGHTSRQGSGHRSSMTISKELQANKTRIGSAKYYDVASALLGKGKADLEELFLNAARDGDFDQIENFLLRRSDVIISIDVKDKRTGNTALIWASKRGHIKIVQLLLRHGADITLRNYESLTAVEVASPAIKTLLLDSVDRSTESSHRLLLQAAWQGNIKVLRKLLADNRVKDINCQNADGLTALLLVCRDIQLFERLSTQLNRPYNPVEVMEELLKHRANIHASDGDDKSCLHYAVQSKAAQASLVVQTILSAGPNLDAKDKRLFAPIHCASQTGNVECLEVLLEGGSNVNHRGFNGTTPLHITAYNDHEKAASCLLKHGADITMVDDTGLTALDLARGRKMKATLKEAWTEATQSRQSTNLAPLKTPGREDTRLSTDDKKRRKGEVIFDALPTNPFSSIKNASNRGGKPVSRHLSLKEKASRAEESMMKDIENGEFKPSPYMKDGVRRLGLVRGQRTSPTPLSKVSSRERLPAISPSPDRMAGDRNTDSPAFNRNTRFRRSLEEGKLLHKNGKPATYPVPGSRPNRVSPLTIRDNNRTSPLTVRDNNRVSPVTVRDTTRISPLTILDDMDVDQCMQINRFQPPSPTPVNSKQVKFHRRAGSDSITTNTNDILESCTGIMHRGQSTSLSHSEDYSDHMTHHVTRYPQREANHYIPLSREPAQKTLCNHGDRCITKTTSEVILDLDRMGLINKCPQTPVQGIQLYPTSSKILPPTPTFANQGENTHLESKTMEDKTRQNSSSKEPSPRSDDEDPINDKEVKMAFSGTLELLRSRSIYKDEFVLEESRPRDLSLRSSSSEESHRSKASEASTSSGEVFTKDTDTAGGRQDGGVSTKKIGQKTNGLAKKTSTNQKQGTEKTDTNKGSAGVNNTASRPSALVTAFVPKQSQFLNNNSVLKNKTENTCNQNKVAKDVTAKSAGENKNKSTLHSQIPNDAEDKQNVPKIEKSSMNNSVGVQSKSGVIRIGPNSAGNKNQMQVVSSKLLSNVKEEIKRNKDLVSHDNDNGKKEEELEMNKEEQEKVLAAKNKLTKSESNMIGIKQENTKMIEVARPKTQASAQNGAVVQKIGSKVIVASANQNARNSTASKNTIIPSNKNAPSASQSTKNSNTSTNQSSKSSVPSYLQPTRSSITRDSSPNTARKTPLNTRNSANKRNVNGNSTCKNQLNSAVAKSGVSQSSASSKQTTFTGISKGNESDETKNASSSDVTSNTNTSAVTVSSTAEKTLTSAPPNKIKTSAVNSQTSAGISTMKSAKSVTSSANSNNRTNINSDTKQTSVSVTSALTSNSRSTQSEGSANTEKGNPASGRASKVGSSSGISSISSQSGIKKSTSDSNISNQLSTSGISSTDTLTAGQSEAQKDTYSSSNKKSDSVTKNDTQSKASNETAIKVPNFPYKPASAGKPPLVEIVTANSPRIPKSKCVDSEVVIPVQTPLIVNPFEELYKEQAAADLKLNDKKGNSKGVSATSYGFVVGKSQIERSKTNVSVKSQGKGGKKGRDGKPSSATAKLGGVRRKGAKSKEGKGSDEGTVSRPKSGKKRARSGKKRKKVPSDVLSKQAAQPDIALISGIGWHLATKCIDTSDVIAVKTRGSQSSLSSLDSEDDLDNPTPRPERMPTEEDLQLLTSQDFQFPLNLDLDTPRNAEIQIDTPAPGPSSAKYLPVNDLNHQDSHSANTPRFKQVKQTEHVEHLPKMDYDGYRPMNLDLSQSTLPAYLNSSQALERNKWKNSLPSDVTMLNMEVGAEDIEVFSNTEFDKATAELHRQILMGKLTPIPESPSIKSSLPIHKTVEALQKFDRNVQGETLDNLLGLSPGEIPVSSRTDQSDHVHSSVKNIPGQTHQKIEGTRSRSSSNGHIASIQSKGSKENNTTIKQRSWSTSDGPIDSKEAVRLSIENIRAAIEKSKKTCEKKSSKIRKSASDSKLARNNFDVPKIDLSQVDHDTDKTDIDQGIRAGQSTRRERKFSETKSDEKVDDVVDENIDEAIEDIMSNTLNSTSTLRSNRSVKTGSRSNTLTDADRQLIMKMTNNESPFHATTNISASACETSRKRHHSDSYDEATAQHSTNPNLLKVFHAGDFKLGQKVKAMIDAGADKEKIKIMINVDNEAKQIAKIMNSFKNMELYAGPGGSYKLNSRKPEISHGEPSSSKKPPFPRPGSGGPISKVRSAGRFTEIRGSRAEDSTSVRNSGQKEKVGPSFGIHQTSQNSSGFPVGDIEEELVNALRCSSPENTTVVSDTYGQYDSMSRSTSACTSVSSQSNLEDTIQWKKGNVLGKGAFGTVWCGLTSEGQLIAVKQIELNTNDKDKAKREYEKVQEEVELLKTLNHKNIVGYLGTSLEEEDSVVSIFMQFVPGGSIASILARFGALDEAVFRRYTRQILEGVQYLHANDVIHRDIKGGNVMLMPNGIIKLIDFGCAKRLCINLSMGQSQILKSMKGTPYWMAPEVVNETGHGKKSDIWSIGCTIFEMATRKPPWSDMNPMAAIFAIGSDRAVPKLPSKFTQEAVDFVDACLTRDQNKRPLATQLLQHNFILKRKNSKK